ncbi:MAG: hypothetical protein ACI9NY_000325 [Kiritimatiellia bacterium]|jgi:hypothetical protein
MVVCSFVTACVIVSVSVSVSAILDLRFLCVFFLSGKANVARK